MSELTERAAQLIAHRTCMNEEHDPANGKISGYCITCGLPWPCSYAGKPPDELERIVEERTSRVAEPPYYVSRISAQEGQPAEGADMTLDTGDGGRMMRTGFDGGGRRDSILPDRRPPPPPVEP